MLIKSTWLLWLTMVMLTTGDSPPRILRDPSFLRLLNKHYSSTHVPKTQWAYLPQEDSYRFGSAEVSHGYTSHPYGSTSKETENSSERPVYSGSLQEFWMPSSVNSSFTSPSYHSYSRPYFGSMNGAGGSYYQDSIQGSPSVSQYLQMRPATRGSYSSLKKVPAYHLKGKLQTQSFDTPGKPKYKKTVSHQSPFSYKKTVYPRVHKPYAKHKYPTQKTVHSLYRRYYQSPYQRYAIPSGEILRYGIKTLSDEYHKTSAVSPTSTSDRYYTTERMDDTYPDGSNTSEDYSTYNDTHHNSSGGGNYYETYEEVEKTTSEPEESSYDESSTRGYYGDRIYMSTQVPLVTSEKSSVKNKYFIVRRTSQDDDIETIFE